MALDVSALLERYWTKRNKTIALVVVALLLLVGAVVALDKAVGGDAMARAQVELAKIPLPRILLAVMLSAASYLLLTAYDTLALRWAGKALPLGTTMLTSFLAYAFAHNVGFGFLAGATVRGRRYGKHGLSAEDVAKVAAFTGATTWMGVAVVGGTALLIEPPHPEAAAGLRALGAAGIALVVAYLGACWWFGGWTDSDLPAEAPTTAGENAPTPVPKQLRLWRFHIAIPSLRLAVIQVLLATADWLLAGAVLAALVAVDVPTFFAAGLRALGAAGIALVVAYLGACWWFGGWTDSDLPAEAPTTAGEDAPPPVPKQLRLWRFHIAIPSLRLAVIQVLLATADWLLAGAVLAALVAVDVPTFFAAMGAFAVAAVVALISHVPGGIGVLEGIVVLLLGTRLPPDRVLGALVAFRFIYYLGPFVIALVTFGLVELFESQTGKLMSRAFRGMVPEVSAVLVLLAGAVLLVSGAQPAIDARMKALHHLVPLPLIEGSHLVGSAVGIGLVILARSLWRRLDSAWVLAIVLLSAGSLASLLKGFDWEEALILALIALVLAPNRDKFHRTGSLLSEPLSGSFVLGVVAVFVATVYVGYLSFEHVQYRHSLWWKMALDANAPRFMRASVATVAVLLAYGTSQLVRPTKLRKREATLDQINDAIRIADTSSESQARLVAMGDKQVVFDDKKTAFVMYGVEGRAFIALGDPIGNPEARVELITKFRKLADAHDAACAFYQVIPDNITDYVDRGFALVKLGEEARVKLSEFGLEGRAMKSLRASHKKAGKDVTFAIVDVADVPAILPQLKRVSDAWLKDKNTREKGFSLGSFDDDYLKTGPVAVAKKGDDIVAFANVWTTSTKEELSIDLMRFDDRAPNGTMDFLFAELMLWGKAQGYTWFSLGMAPMSGLDDGPLSPWWSRTFALIFRHGEALYNFKGLRAYKEKFDPVWRSRYLACARAIDVPRVLASVATLTSRGLTGVFAR